MKTIVIMSGMFVASWLGWLAGESLGFGFFGNFVLSSVASFAGIYVGWRITRRLDA